MKCPKCARMLQLRMPAAVMMACPSCLAVLDLVGAAAPTVRAEQVPLPASSHLPVIPLGRSGEILGRATTCVGYITRLTPEGGRAHVSEEYVLRDAKGRAHWLVHEDGVWFFLSPEDKKKTREAGGFGGGLGTGDARARTVETTFVGGELPVALPPGHQSQVSAFFEDVVVTTVERDAQGEQWFVGRRLSEGAVWSAFDLRPESVLDMGVGFVFLLVMLQVASCVVTSREPLQVAHLETTAEEADHARVTDSFELRRRGALEVEIEAPLTNDWASFGLALLSADQSRVIERVVVVEQWSGWDDEGRWSEGGPRSTAIFPSVPAGVWRLRVEPHTPRPVLSYSVRVRHALPRIGWLVLAALALAPMWWLAHVRGRGRARTVT